MQNFPAYHMGKGIKTRSVAEKTIKAIDKSAVASERMKEAYIRTKDKAEHGLYAEEGSPGEYASDRVSSGVENTAREVVHQFDKQGRKGVKTTKENISKVKENIQKRKAAAEQPKKQAEKQAARQTRQAADRISEPVKAIRQERGAVKTLDRGQKSIKTVDRSRKTIKQESSTAKGTVKTASKSIKTAEKTAKASIKTTQQVAKTAQKTAQATARAARAAAHAARAAGGWVAVLVIIVICLIGMIVGSCFGIFFFGEDSGTGQTMQTAVQEINAEYEEKLEEIKTSHTYDVLEMSGSRAVWKEVLAVYAVKTTTDPDAAQEVATMDDSKKQLLKDIFWQMNEISSNTSTQTETIIETSDDGNGNIVETEVTVTRTYLYITVSHKTAEEMADQFSFHEDQREQMAELLADENNSLWSQVLYGITGGDGDIIFFDWDDGGQDGSSDHVGIVEKVENGRVYTVEGNSGDSVRQNSYPVGYYEIYGYGTPAY